SESFQRQFRITGTELVTLSLHLEGDFLAIHGFNSLTYGTNIDNVPPGLSGIQTGPFSGFGQPVHVSDQLSGTYPLTAGDYTLFGDLQAEAGLIFPSAPGPGPASSMASGTITVTVSAQAAPVPEPASLHLLGLGLIVLAAAGGRGCTAQQPRPPARR